MSARSAGDQRSALVTATVVTLAAAGGVSALFFAFTSASGEAAVSEPLVVTEYVDQQGNPVDLTSLTTQPGVIYVDEQGGLLPNAPSPGSTDADAATAAPMAPEVAAPVQERDHEGNDYEENDHEEGDHDDD